MSEHVLVRQNNNFEIEFLAEPSDDSAADKLQPVHQIHELNPYGMLLASVGSCTSIVLHTYARNHGIDLREVELDLKYQRSFRQDSESSDSDSRYEEQISEKLTFTGDLTSSERQKLVRVAQQCSIHKMLTAGIEIDSRIAESAAQ